MAERTGVRGLRDKLTSGIRRVRTGELVAGDVTQAQPLANPLRRFPVIGGKTASQALEDDRASRG